jgi:hypothetical protein
MTRSLHDIRYNPVDDEIVVNVSNGRAILTFRGGANGQEGPIRILQGPNTQLSGNGRFDIDTMHDELFVGGQGAILVYPLHANGDVAPLRVIRGSNTQNPGGSIAVDPINNLIASTGRDEGILIFDRTANGNVAPLRVIRGANTQIDRINQMAIYPEGRLLVVAMPGIQSYMEPPRVFVGMWSLDDDGDFAPKWVIAGEKTTMGKTFGVAINAEHKEIYVSDMRRHGVLTYSVPEVFVPVGPPAPGERPPAGGRRGGDRD